MPDLPVLVACLHAGLAAIVVVFQVLLVFGAPWGHLTMGARHTGRLDPAGRTMAAASAVLLIAVAVAVLSAAGLGAVWPRWTLWAAITISALSTLANAVTPSAPERRLWLPIVSLMLLCALVVAFTGGK